MIAYSRGSNRLAGTASLKNRMPATVGAFRLHPGVAQLAEQQTCNLWAAGSTPAIQPLCEKQPNLSDPGLAPAALAR
jgi:phytoene dehydrogenase-like protein